MKLFTSTSFLIFISLLLPLKAQHPGDEVFTNPQIIDFYFYFDQTDYLDSLYKSQSTGEYISGHVRIDGVFYDNIGVRFKGFSSFWGYPGDKKSLRIKFNKYKDHRFNGLKKVSLNNGWNDPTMLREKLFLDFLYEHDIHAPRANFARVFINDTYHGFYTLVEHVDKTFLQHRFNDNDGNLYKAEKLADLTWQGSDQEQYYEQFELKTNEKENNWQGLIHFLNVINNSPDNEFGDSLETVFDTGDYIRGWAANNLFVNLDSYLSSATNYYLYHHLTDKRFRWIIWDVNLAFAARGRGADLDILDEPSQHPLITRMLANETYKNSYLNYISEYLENYLSGDSILSRIDMLAELIRDAYVADTLKMYTNDQIEIALDQEVDRVPGLKTFILERRENVRQQLTELSQTSDIPVISAASVPSEAHLYQNYPNPFNPRTAVGYRLSALSDIELSIYDIRGREIAILTSGLKQAGYHEVIWDAADFASGIYFATLTTNGRLSGSKKLLLQK